VSGRPRCMRLLEALFVDEGFGTLDKQTMGKVMNVLDGRHVGGRIVDIVSHVSELRQRIPARTHVRKSRAGSHVGVAFSKLPCTELTSKK
jgi:exonuclease SbcC